LTRDMRMSRSVSGSMTAKLTDPRTGQDALVAFAVLWRP
jgi:hypothetical protein